MIIVLPCWLVPVVVLLVLASIARIWYRAR